MRRNWLAARFSKSFGSSKKRRRQALGRQVEALEHRTLLSFTLGTSKVRMADDYFAIEQGRAGPRLGKQSRDFGVSMLFPGDIRLASR